MSLKHTEPDTPQKAAIIARSRQLTDFKWTPIRDVPTYIVRRVNGEKVRYRTVLPAGKEITGFPYSSNELTDKFITENVSIESFLSAIPNPYSKLYQPGKGAVNSCSIGIVCNGLARYALSIKRRVSTARWATIPGMIKVAEKGNYRAEDIKLCDVIHAFNDGRSHVALITDIIKDETDKIVSIEVSEATPPLCIRKCYSVEEYFKKFDPFALWRYDYLENVPLLDQSVNDLLSSGIEKTSPKISIDNGNKSNYIEGEETVIYVSVSGDDVLEVICDGVLVEEIYLIDKIIIPREFKKGYYTLKLRNTGESVEFCVNKAKISHSVCEGNITVKADACDEFSEILYFDFRIAGDKVASLSKYEELTEEEKETGVFTRKIPEDAENFKVYFRNKYGVWVHRMTKIIDK